MLLVMCNFVSDVAKVNEVIRNVFNAQISWPKENTNHVIKVRQELFNYERFDQKKGKSMQFSLFREINLIFSTSRAYRRRYCQSDT